MRVGLQVINVEEVADLSMGGVVPIATLVQEGAYYYYYYYLLIIIIIIIIIIILVPVILYFQTYPTKRTCAINTSSINPITYTKYGRILYLGVATVGCSK